MHENHPANLLLLVGAGAPAAAPALQPVEGDYVIHDFRFASGDVLPALRVHYTTLGQPLRDASGQVTNAVLILHGTGGRGANFLRQDWMAELFGPGQPLDTARYFVIFPDSIGHGSSSKPSDGLRARFPRYDYADMVRAQYRLVSEALDVKHLRLIIGASMGGMHAWQWAVTYPDAMDAIVPMVCLAGGSLGTQPHAAATDHRRSARRSRLERRRVRHTSARAAYRAATGDDLRRQRTRAVAAGAHRERSGQVPGRLRPPAPAADRCQRLPVCVGSVYRLRSLRAAAADPRAGSGHQLRGRRAQPARPGDHGARDRTRWRAVATC